RTATRELVATEPGRHREEPQASRGAVDAGLVVKRLAEHLQAAADADDASAGPNARGDRIGQPGTAEPGKVGSDVLRAGQDDELGVSDLSRPRRPLHARNLLQQAELIEVRSRRVTNDCDGRAGAV